MKKIFILTIFTLIILSCKTTKTVSNQVYKENIKTAFVEYNNHILNMEFEKSMEYMLPEFFEIIPKSQMVLLMKQTFNNPEMEFKMDKPKDIIIGNAKKINEKYYSLINYTYDIKMKFNNNDETEISDDEKKLTQNLIKLSLEKTFGSENVKFNNETEFYEIHSKKDAYGISKDGLTDWKFVVIEKKQKYILEKILPKELTENI